MGNRKNRCLGTKAVGGRHDGEERAAADEGHRLQGGVKGSDAGMGQCGEWAHRHGRRVRDGLERKRPGNETGVRR